MASAKSKTGSTLAIVLLFIAAVALYLFEHLPKDASEKSSSAPKSEASKTPGKPKTNPAAPSARRSTGKYETYDHCTLVNARNNDGDSFVVRLPDGRQVELRLYYVDAPESAFKRYPGGDTNHVRIRQQAADLGGITPEQAVEIGQAAKSFTLALLEDRPFTIHTVWDSPYDDERYHAFVEVQSGGQKRWLHELLIERGLARIKTKPADLPDGTPVSKQRQRLRELEKKARQAEMGAWKM